MTSTVVTGPTGIQTTEMYGIREQKLMGYRILRSGPP